MKKISVLIYFILISGICFSQLLSTKSITLPEKINSINFLPKERLLLSPDGTILCFVTETDPYRAFFINVATGTVEDSVAINSYASQVKWSGDSKTIIVYSYNYSGSKFELYNRKGEPKGIIETSFPVLNFETDSSASEIAMVQYKLSETGALYETDITGAYIYPKGIQYHYKVCLINIANRQISDSFSVKATYPIIKCKWNGKWTMLINQSEAEFQSYTYAASIDFAAKKIVPIANSKELFVNESLMNLQLLSADKLYIHSKADVFELDEKIGKFNSILRPSEIENVAINKSDKGVVTLIAGARGKRWVENTLQLINHKNEKSSIDIKEVIPHLVHQANDTASVFTFSKNEVFIKKYLTRQNVEDVSPEILVQNSIEPGTKMTIPNSSFLLEYNNKEWQVTDMSSQLIVHQQRDYENYGSKFITTGSNPFIIKYSNDKAVLIPIGKWNDEIAKLQLQHPLLQEGSTVYKQTLTLNSLVYNTSTTLLTGLFNTYDNYYLAAWDLQKSYTPAYVIKVERKKITKEDISLFSQGSSPYLLAQVAYFMEEQDWKNAGQDDIVNRFKKFTGKMSPFLASLLEQINDYSWRYNIEQGKATGNFAFQDSIYGHIVIDVLSPSQSVYFCHKKLKGGFSTLQFAPYITEGYGAKQIALSDNGNFITVSNLGHIDVYDLKAKQYNNIIREKKDQNFDGSAYFFVENKDIIIGKDAWYATTGLNPVHTLSRTLYIDSANYFPEKKIFVAHTTGRNGYLTIRLDNMMITQAETNSLPLLSKYIKDTIVRNYFPQKKYWMIAGERGLGYDSSNKIKPDFMGRLFASSLNGTINFVQMLPEVNKVLLGNTDEGTFEYWDAITEQRVFKLVIANENNFIIQGKSGYYYATPNALQQIGFLQKGDAIPASFLDAGLNRPDIVLSDLYDTTESSIGEYVNIYRKAAYLKNKRNASILPGKSPSISIAQSGGTLFKEKEIKIKAILRAADNPINYFSIQINNVLVWDTVFSKPTFSVQLNKSIDLSAGENQLVFQARDMGGFASVPLFQRIVYQPVQKQISKTYIIAMAVNNYSDDSRNLKYAVKDGKDLLVAFRSVDGAVVTTDSLFDASFTVANVEKLREKLMQTTIEDKVILSFSGHGMLDDSLNFYLATYDMNFDNPKKNGLSFAALENLLTGIPARKKLLLIDACNSGNIDKDASELETNERPLIASVSIQSDTTKSKRGVELPVPANTSLQQVINQLFVSTSSKGGIEVIAATAGNAYAFEAPKWNNGVFTYALLQTFYKNSDLDKNFDGQISIKEIKKFVYPQVLHLTNGLQQPLSRYENPNYDWNLFPMRYD